MGILTGIVAVWNFNESSGTSAADASGNGHTGTLSGTSVPTWSAGLKNNAVNLAGGVSGATASYISVPTSTDLNMSTGDFTFSYWMKPSNTSGFFGGFDTGYSSAGSLLVEFQISGGNLITRAYVSGVSIYGTPTFAYTAGNWYHVVVRRIGTTFEIKVNNVSLGTASVSTAISCPAVNMSLGRYGGGGENLHGLLDMFEIRKGYGLTDAEITTLYNSGAGLQYPYTNNTGNFFQFFN